VSIGKGSVIGKMTIIKDMVQVLEGTIVPAGMVIPVGSVVGGRPGRVVGEVGVAWEGPDGRELWRNTTNPIPPTS
jgi:dynactin-5